MLYPVPGLFNQISERRHLIRKKVGLPPRRFALCAVVGFAVVRFMGLCRVMRSFFTYCNYAAPKGTSIHSEQHLAISTSNPGKDGLVALLKFSLGLIPPAC